ncbi:MAG TPA: GNAT family N-acetyltransferase [Candidatus Limnocylindrales bacterium]
MTIEIRPLRVDEIDQAASMLARAFFDDPGTLIVEPDDDRREAAILALFPAVVRHALAVGDVTAAVDADGTVVGIATWLPPGRVIPTEAEIVASGLLEAIAAAPEAAERMGPMVAYLDAQMEHAIHGPHWRLEFFGVEPGLQGTGVGSRLVAPGHARADANGERCYLETFTRKNVAWYEKRGYRVAVEGVVPATDVPVWGMVRDPQPA